ncbi:MAG: MmcQ/YjbR family DNA-binding protein [Chloroflexota bacterium]|nr:MmcQ/YjbR family DNA-binding protein [Chloroflexota bacterium]
MSENLLAQLHEICLDRPERTEKLSWNSVPTCRVRDKIFAQYEANHDGDGRVSLWCKAPPGIQDPLVGSDPVQFFVPPYVGHHGWICVRLDVAVDWDEVTDLVHKSYRMTAPKRLAAAIDG